VKKRKLNMRKWPKRIKRDMRNRIKPQMLKMLKVRNQQVKKTQRRNNLRMRRSRKPRLNSELD